jgi:hypothetical protein
MKLHEWQEHMKKKTRPGKDYHQRNQWSPASPNPDAVKRVLNPLPVPTRCHLCGGEHISLENNSVVYNGKSYGDWPYIYLCNACRAYVGLHPETNIPLGTLADEETRQARKLCKDPFEKLWRSGKWHRNEAYQKLAEFFNIEKEECHFAWFTTEMCYEAREWSIEKQKELGIYVETTYDKM